jgi:hypothetical protein
LVSRVKESGNKYGNKRVLRIMLSSVLAVTLLQIAPPAKAVEPTPECSPRSSLAFDGLTLNAIYDFTIVGTCQWSNPPNLTGAKFAIVAGGDGGGQTAPGLGGEINSTTWMATSPMSVVIGVGSGGQGAQETSSETSGTASSIQIEAVVLQALPSVTPAQNTYSFLGRPQQFGGSARTGLDGINGFGIGGGEQTNAIAGDGGSGRVVISVPSAGINISRYTANDFVPATGGNAAYWGEVSDPSNLSRRASAAGSPVRIVNPSGYGLAEGTSFPVIQGGPSDSIDFPVAMTQNYTFFSVARYNERPLDQGQYRRIFDGVGTNWLSGFHGNVSGVAFHGDIGVGDGAGWISG